MIDSLAAFIQCSEGVVVDLETELTRRPALSPDSGGEGELDKCEWLERWLRRNGLTMLERFDSPDVRAKGGGRPNLVLTLRGKDDSKRFWIMSHLDVVPPGERGLWESDPWIVTRRVDGPLGPRLVGRGVEDNQQGIVCSVIAALALIREGIVPNHTVKLLFAADEENGSKYGILWLLDNVPDLFKRNDMVLVPDSGDSRGETIEIAEKKMIRGRFHTVGKQAHASRPDQGTNAFIAACNLALRLDRGLKAKFSARDALFEPPYSTFEATKKESNVPNINTIPGDDVFYMDMRVLPCYEIAEINAEIERICAEIEAEHGVHIEYTSEATESRATSADAPLVRLLADTVREESGVTTRLVGIGGGTVAARLRNRGIDAVVWGCIDETAHQPGEYAVISQILTEARIMAALMMRA